MYHIKYTEILQPFAQNATISDWFEAHLLVTDNQLDLCNLTWLFSVSIIPDFQYDFPFVFLFSSLHLSQLLYFAIHCCFFADIIKHLQYFPKPHSFRSMCHHTYFVYVYTIISNSLLRNLQDIIWILRKHTHSNINTSYY